MANALTRKAQHTLNTIVITQLNLLRGLKNLGVQSVSHRQASKDINGSNSFKLEPVVLCDLGKTFSFEESVEHLAVDVVKVLVEAFTRNIRVK